MHFFDNHVTDYVCHIDETDEEMYNERSGAKWFGMLRKKISLLGQIITP